MSGDAQKIFDEALVAAKAALELKPIIERIRDNPSEAAQLLFQQMQLISLQKKAIQEFKEKVDSLNKIITEQSWIISPDRMGK